MRTDDALRYRERAADCALRAEAADDPVQRQGWLDMQAHWIALAEAAEKYPIRDNEGSA
jgi:hypothetical protein